MAVASYSIKPSNFKYTNWLKACLAVLITKEGIEPFVYNEIKQFQQQCLVDICKDNGLPPGTICSNCCTEKVVVCPTNRICNTGSGGCSYHKGDIYQYLPTGCPYQICHNLKNEIKNAHRYYGPSYKNTNAKQWCTNPWEVAKCFMPPDGYKDVTSPAETDFNGIISVLINYKDVQAKISDDLSKKGNIFEKGKIVGKSIRWSPSFEVEDAELQQYYTDLQNLLSDPKLLANSKDAQNAREKLSQLQNDTLFMDKKFQQLLKYDAKDVHQDIKEERKSELIEAIKEYVDTIEATGKAPLSEISDALKSALSDIERKSKLQISEIEREMKIAKNYKYNKLKKEFKATNLAKLPREILNMDRRAIELYIKALSDGETNVRNIRLMIVGHYGAGKTTLAKRLFGETVDITERKSTDGIDVHVGRRKVSLKTKTWLDTDGQRKVLADRLVTLIHNTNDAEQQLPVISNNDVSDSDDPIQSMSSKEERKVNTQRSNTVHLDSSSTNEHHEADRPHTLAPNLSASEISHVNELEEENVDAQNAWFLRQKNHLEEFVKEAENGGFIQDENHCDLSLWDFAGQSVFHTTHQAFLSRRTIYLLVFDISKKMTDTVEDDRWCYDCKGEQTCTIGEMIEYWLNTIHEFCSCLEDSGPPIILVGTFVDRLKNRSDLAKKAFYYLRCSLVGKVANSHLQDEHFEVDNSLDENEIIEKLRQYVVKVASEQSYWGESIPARWVSLEDRLIRLKEEHEVIHMDKLKDVNSQLPVPIEKQTELDLFLKFHHETGTILYFGDDDMKNDILLQPQWLIDAFKSLITAAMFCIPKRNIQNMWLEFVRSAILKPDLILLIWQEKENSSYLANKDLILRFMEKLGFCAKPKRCLGEVTQAEDFFLVPCMLKDPPPANIITCNDTEQCKSTSKLCLTNHKDPDKRFIPSTAFNKLIAACIKQWPLAIENKKYMIFCGGAEFQLEDNHFLYVFLYDHVIQIWISRKSKAGHIPTKMVCQEVKNKIETILKENVRMQRKMLSFVKCPWYTLHSNENMVCLQEKDQGSEIPCYCRQPRVHDVVSFMDLANCWLPEDRVQDLHLDLEKKPTEKDFSRISGLIGKEYTQLAFQLGISQPKLDHIEMDHDTTPNKITAVLNMWANSHDQATYGNLIKAMQDSGIDYTLVFKE